MSVTNKTISCIGCNQPYDDKVHQPQILDCGHGTCKTCLPNTPVCQTLHCHHLVQAPHPNFELLDQLNDHSAKFTAGVVKTTKQYQDLAKSLDDEISEVDAQLSALKDKFVGEVFLGIQDESKDLEPKAQELVTLGVFDDLEQAKTALSSAGPKTMPREKFSFKTVSEASTKASDTESIYSCGICLDSYTAVGAHEPVVFNCGHGSCVSCVDYMQKNAMESCHLCRQPLNSTVVNKDLIGQMNLDTKELSERFKPHQYVIEFKKKYLCESEVKFETLKNSMAARFENTVVVADEMTNHPDFTTHIPFPNSSSSSSTSTTTSTSVVNTNEGMSEWKRRLQRWNQKLRGNSDRFENTVVVADEMTNHPDFTTHIPFPNSSSSSSTSTTTSTSVVNTNERMSERQRALQLWKQKLMENSED